MRRHAIAAAEQELFSLYRDKLKRIIYVTAVVASDELLYWLLVFSGAQNNKYVHIAPVFRNCCHFALT